MRLHVGIGAEFEHAARDVNGAFELPGPGEFGAVANVDEQGVVLRKELAGLIRRNPRHRFIGRGQQLFYGSGHRSLPVRPAIQPIRLEQIAKWRSARGAASACR